MSKNNTLWTAISVIVIFVFLFIVYAASNKPQTESKPIPQLQTAQSNDHVKWGKNQKNILVEFSDLQCPACRSFHEFLKSYEASGSAQSKVASKIAFVYKHFPLDQVHKNARVAAYAAEAAGKQGKFFEMTYALFENQTVWEKSNDPVKIFQDYTKELDLNTEQLKKDMSAKDVKDRVDRDVLLGNQAGVNSTPTFFLNGKKMEFSSLEDFQKQLSDAVK